MRRVILPALVAAVFTVSAATNAHAGGLFGGLFGHNNCCDVEPVCGCEPVCEPVCGCEPVCEPVCGCEVDCCDSHCRKPLLGGLFSGLFKRHHNNCCEPVCGYEPACEPVCGCEPVCEPVCGCEPVCEPACGCEIDCCDSHCHKPLFGGLLKKLFKRKNNCCEPACGYEPVCGCEPVCGFEPACGCGH